MTLTWVAPCDYWQSTPRTKGRCLQEVLVTCLYKTKEKYYRIAS